MRVVHVASEVAPFAQSGGLADVAAGLPAALAEAHGLSVGVVVPLYRGVAEKLAARADPLATGGPCPPTSGPPRFEGCCGYRWGGARGGPTSNFTLAGGNWDACGTGGHPPCPV